MRPFKPQGHKSTRVRESAIMTSPFKFACSILGWNGHGMLKNRSLVLVLVLRTVFCAPGPLVGPRRSLLARSDAGQQTASAANSNNRARRDAGPQTTSISQLAVMQGSANKKTQQQQSLHKKQQRQQQQQQRPFYPRATAFPPCEGPLIRSGANPFGGIGPCHTADSCPSQSQLSRPRSSRHHMPGIKAPMIQHVPLVYSLILLTTIK